MNKITRLIAGSMTSIVALGALSAPAFAVTDVTPVETAICTAVAPQVGLINDALDDALALLTTQQSAVTTAQTGMNASSALLGTTGLAYIKALDGVGNVNGTLAAFTAAATDFSGDVTTWVAAVDEAHENTVNSGLNGAVGGYLEGLCAI